MAFTPAVPPGTFAKRTGRKERTITAHPEFERHFLRDRWGNRQQVSGIHSFLINTIDRDIKLHYKPSGGHIKTGRRSEQEGKEASKKSVGDLEASHEQAI